MGRALRYISVCSGIEAATVAWKPLGWEAVAFAEVEKFPSAVLEYRHPQTPNFGDITKFKHWRDYEADVLVGGTPCQSFSVAGLRKGLDDPRGNLMFTYLAIVDRYRPKWLVWENVPGVLSSNGGQDFGTFLGALAELGYGFAYRVLDAQYFGVPQRRRRVFVVGYLGDWRRTAAVLFERHSLQGHSPPSRETGKGVAGDIGEGTSYCTTGAGFWREGIGTLRAREQDAHENLICNEYYESHPNDSRITGPHKVANTVSARYGTGGRNTPLVMAHGQANAEMVSDGSPSLTCNHEAPIVCHGTQDPCVGDKAFALGRNSGQENAICFMAGQGSKAGSGTNRTPCVAFSENVRSEVRETPIAQALTSGGGKPGQGYPAVRTGTQVRRLTPVECERLQGFPDSYTAIPWRGKSPENCPNGLRYKALGNSMAVPVMRWIGERIQMAEVSSAA